MSKREDLVGKQFGDLTVIAPLTKTILGREHFVAWLCRCKCGKEVKARPHDLGSLETTICKHLERKHFDPQFYGSRHRTHGGSNSRLYGVYRSMLKRCYNPNCNRYKIYGGRGITVCEEWKTHFEAFREWAMAHGYDEHAPRGKCTLDRIDPDKGYCPDNCRWVDMKTQSRHTVNTVYLTINGETKPLVEWAECDGAPSADTMRSRRKRGWSDEEVFYGKK